jgi:transcriptional regulator with XRE-family HTH domain
VSESLHKAQVGRRLRAAIETLGITQTEVAKALGVTPSKLGNWLRGDNYPTAWFVKRFCDRYGITTDWIYRGIVSGMSSHLADELWKSEQAASLKEVEAATNVHELRATPPRRR